MKGRIILTVISQILVTGILIYFITKIINVMKYGSLQETVNYSIVIFLIVLWWIRNLMVIIRDYKEYVLDKKEGISEKELELIGVKNPVINKAGPPGRPIYTFKYIDNNEDIELYEFEVLLKQELFIGKKYKVKYFKHSMVLLEVKEI